MLQPLISRVPWSASTVFTQGSPLLTRSDNSWHAHTFLVLLIFAASEGILQARPGTPSMVTSAMYFIATDLHGKVLKTHKSSWPCLLMKGGNWVPSVPRISLQVLFSLVLPSASAFGHQDWQYFPVQLQVSAVERSSE